MSLIPYTLRDSQEIVLRHEDALVLHDPRSKQLILRGATPSLRPCADNNLSECPLCHQSIRSKSPERDGRANALRRESFVSPEYFRMLQAELGAESQPPSSPIRRLVEPSYARNPTATVEEEEEEEGEEEESAEAFVFDEHGNPTARQAQNIKRDAFSQDYYNKFFTEERELGRGGKGVVYLVKHELDGVFLGYFACKRVPVGDDHAWLEKVLIEVQLLQRLSHPNLVAYRHVWLEDFRPNRFGPTIPCAFILQQYCNAGDLLKYITSNKPKILSTKEQMKEHIRKRSMHRSDHPGAIVAPRKLSFDDIYSFFRDITSGLAHLHAFNYIHRDLKPSNCLLHRTGSEIRCLISDFGEVQSAAQLRKSTGATGTVAYCAPEVLKANASGRYGEFSTKSDIFSLGMILYFMCFERLPYSSADAIEEENEDLDILRAEISAWSGFEDEQKERPDLPEKLFEFLKRLLAIDPMERPSAEEIQHAINTGSGLTTSQARRTARPISRGPRIFEPVDTPAERSPFCGVIADHVSGKDASSDDRVAHSMSGAKPSGSDNTIEHSYEHSRDASIATNAEANADAVVAVKEHQASATQHLLPAPPTTRLSQLHHTLVVLNHNTLQWYLTHHTAKARLVALLFSIAKVWYLLSSCSPLLPNPAVAYPSLVLVALELQFCERIGGLGMFMGSIVQSAVFGWLLRSDRVCPGQGYVLSGLAAED